MLRRRARGPSARRVGVAGLLVAALLLPAPALAGTFRVFGPQDFFRSTGAPVTETRSVTVPNPATAFTLTIYNGGMQDAEFERVSSSVITVNGVQVVGPSEFNQTVVWIAKPVPLQATNTLSVELRGKPNGQVTIVIDGVDNEPPAITASLDPLPNAAGWHHADVTVRFTCADAISGVASCPAPVVLTTEGSPQVVTGTATDLAGNTATASVAIHLDTTPPVLTSTLTPAANAAGWSQADTTVVFAATDALSGIATTSAPVLVTTEGATQGVTGTATDVAGNSATLSTTVQLDRTPPTLTPVVTPAPNAAGWHMSDVTVSFTATDSLSGLATATPPVVVTTDGAGQVVSGSATDVAGNTASATATLSLDRTPPTISATVAPPPNAAGWHQAAPTVTFTCTDLLSQIAACPAPVTVMTEGAGQVVPGTAVDVAGNPATASVTVSLDTTAPVVTITAPPEGAVIPTPSVTVTGTVSEAVANLTVNDVPATVTAGAFTVEVPLTLATTTLVAVATDPASHTGSATRTITLDTTSPVVRILTPATGQVLRTPTVTVTGTLDDSTAAVTVNGVAATIADGRFTAAGVALGAGATALTAEARDPAGNVGTDQVAVTFDGTPPTVSLTAPAAVTAGLPVALEVQATDNLGLATIDLLVDGRLAASGSTSPVTTTFLIPPDRAVGDTLTVTARAVDLAGAVTQQLATMAVTAAAVGPGFLRGLVLDDTTGLPLAGATVTVSGTGTTPIAPQTTGADGSYAVTLEPGSALVRVTKGGMTAVERTVPVRSGLLTVVPDARPTARAALAPLLGQTGGTAADAGNVIRLTVPPGALGADVTLAAARVSGQGLAARLPLGWSPLLAVDLDPVDTPLSAPVQLTLRLPEALQALLPPASTVPVARYDPGPQAWVALAPGTVTADGLAVELSLGALGQIVLLRPDAALHTPPAVVAGQPLAGVAVVAIPETATAASELTPKAVPPGQATATMTIGVASAAPLPSGTTVQAVVRETYTLRSGAAVTPPGFTQDVVLFACEVTGCGPANTLGARIPVTPSKRFTLQELAVGSVTVAVQTPEAEGPGTLIGPAGGSVTASDGTVLTIPPTALARETVVALTPVAAAELRVGLPAGVQVLRAVAVDLTGAALSRSAELAFPVPEGLAPTDQVLVARVLEVDGLLHLQVVALGRLDGGLLTSRGSVAGASLPGLTSGGTVLFLRATSPFGFVTGVVQTATGVARPGVVVTSPAGFVDVSRADGRYVLATTAGSVTVTAADAATGQGAVQAVTVSAGAATAQPLQVATIPPQVVTISPAAGATNVPVQTQVAVTFSKPVARTSVTSATLVLSSAAGAVDTVVTLSATGTVATLYPTRALAPQTPYTVQATTAITDAQGAPLAAPVTSPFTTVDTTPPPPPAAGAISVSFPDLNQAVTVTATQGTAEPNALVTVLNLSSGSAASATVQADGSFTARLFAFLGDELVIAIQDAAGNQTVVSPGPYRSATGEFVVTAQGGVVEGDGGVRVTLPAGALVGPATVKVSLLAQADLPAPLPQGETFAGGIRLASDQPFKTDVNVTLPIPAGMTLDPKARPFLARYEVIDGVQTPVMIDSLRVVNGELTTSSPPFLGVLAAGDYFAVVPALPFPALVSGVVSRLTAAGTTEPVAGAVIRSGLRTARSGPDGRWALFVFPANTASPETFVFTASDPTTGVAQSKTVRVGAWVTTGVDIAGGAYTLNFALDPAPATFDQTPPRLTLGVQAPSLQAGRVTVGDLVTVTLRVTDDRGLRPDSVTLLVNDAPVQVTSAGNGTDFTGSFTASAVNTIYRLVATARDVTGNEGRAEARLLTISGAPPPSRPGIPFVLTTGIVPPDGAIDVNVFTELEVPFSEGIANLSATTVVLQEAPDGPLVPADLLLNGTTASDRVVVRPRGNLKFGTTYRLTLLGSLADQDGEPLGADVTTRFTTKALTKAAMIAGNFRDIVRLDDRYALLLDRDAGLQVVDVAIPSQPIPVGTPVRPFFVLAQPSAYQGLAVVRDVTYEVPGEAAPRTLDLAIVVGFRWIPGEGAQGVMGVIGLTRQPDPVTGREVLIPQRLGDTVLADRTAGLPMRVLVKDGYALVSTTSMGVLVVDVAKALAVVANPEAFPLHQRGSVVGLFDAGGELTFPVGLAAYQQDALVGDINRGLYRLNLSALPAITGERLLATRVFRFTVVEAFPIADPATGAVRVTDLALITNSNGLTVVDLGIVPPTTLQTLSLPAGSPFDIAVNRERGLVFVANGAGGLTALDLRQPSAPVVIGTRDDLGVVNGNLTLDREYAYVTGPGGLQVVQYDPCCVQILIEVVNDQHYRDRLLNGKPVSEDGVFYIQSLGDPNSPGDPQNPLRFEMPQLRLRARLVNPDGTAELRRQDYWIKWEVTLRYGVAVRVTDVKVAQRRTHDDALTWRSTLAVRLPAYWQPSVQNEPLTEWVDIPWDALTGERRNPDNPAVSRIPFTPAQPFVGGGTLTIAATLLEAPNATSGQAPTLSRPTDGLTRIGPMGSGENVNAYRIFVPTMSPDTTSSLDPHALRIEGQFASAAGNRPAFKVDGQLRARVIRYLKNPTGIETTPPRAQKTAELAETIRSAVTEPTETKLRENLFRLIAYNEVTDRLRHFLDLTDHPRLAKSAGVPAEAVWPIINNSGGHTDGGYGLMQLTELDDPTLQPVDPDAPKVRTPTYSEVWDFRQNIDAAIELLGHKLEQIQADADAYPEGCQEAGADPDDIEPLSVKDKRMALYKRYNSSERVTATDDPRYLRPLVDISGACKPAKTDTRREYVKAMQRLEDRLAGVRTPPID